MFQQAWLVASKDLRIERRSKIGISQIVPFAATVLLLFGFALDADPGMLRIAATGFFWVVVLLCAVLAVQRSFAIESADKTRDGLRLLGLEPAAIFLGKTTAIVVQLVLLELVMAAAVVVLYDVAATMSALMLLTAIAATIGIASAGTIYGALAFGQRSSHSLLPLLFFPVVAPVMLAATRASEAALTGLSEGWMWLQLLGMFAGIYVVAGTLVFGFLLED